MCQAIFPKRRRICQDEKQGVILFLCSGHWVQSLDLSYLTGTAARFRKFLVRREAHNLYVARRLSRKVVQGINEREERGQDASHLWPRIAESNAYAQAYAEALDRIGWLDAAERIIRSGIFSNGTGQDTHRDSA